jgi:hypothetical protein
MKNEFSIDAENIATEFDKLKEKTLEEKLKIIQKNYLTKGCDGKYCENMELCKYDHGCSYKLNNVGCYNYCAKNYFEEK